MRSSAENNLYKVKVEVDQLGDYGNNPGSTHGVLHQDDSSRGRGEGVETRTYAEGSPTRQADETGG